MKPRNASLLDEQAAVRLAAREGRMTVFDGEDRFRSWVQWWKENREPWVSWGDAEFLGDLLLRRRIKPAEWTQIKGRMADTGQCAFAVLVEFYRGALP